MATFSISLSVNVEADSYEEAYEAQKKFFEIVEKIPGIHGVFENDVELIDGEVEDDEYDGQPDEAQEWHDFDPDC